MATIKLKFRASSVAEKEGTLYYQVIHKRNVKWISTDYHVFQNEWDDKVANIAIPPNGERIQELSLIKSAIAWELRLRRRTLNRLETSNDDLSLNELCEAFSLLPPCKTVFTFLEEQVERQEQMQKYGTANTYISAYRRFKEYRQNKDLVFDELTPDMMEEYEAWLANRNQKPNTIRFYLRTLSTLFCKAASCGILSEERKLFGRVRLSYVTTAKRALSEAAILALQNLELGAGTTLAFARDMFMFSFYMRGMPFVDIAYLKKSDLKNGILTYRRKKTNQPLLVEWEQVHQEIVERYAHQTGNSPYMFPIIEQADGTEYKQYKRMQEKVNRTLKKIGIMIGLKMPLTAYVARHSWASIARDMNIPIPIISEGMGHQSYKTTQVYLNSIDVSKISEANRTIIQRIRKEKK